MSLIGHINHPSPCVIRRHIPGLPTDHHYPYNRIPQTVSSTTPTQSISKFSVFSVHEGRTSEEPEDMDLDSSDEDSRPVGEVENASSMTAATNTHITCRFSAGFSSSLGVSGSNTTDSGEDLGTSSLSSTHPRTPHLFISLSAHDCERESSAAPLGSTASHSLPGGHISIVHSTLLNTSHHPTSSNVPSPQVNGPIFCDA